MTFKNPIAHLETPDPFMTYDPVTAYYYMLYTHCNDVLIHRSRHAALCRKSTDTKVVYRLGEGGGICSDIWAPEMHKAPNGKWYIYTSGAVESDPSGEKHLFILESETADPFDGFHFKCLPTPDVFSIDPSVFCYGGKQYICDSRVVMDRIPGEQVLEIAELDNPYTYGKKRGIVARVDYDWEKDNPGIWINEGAFFVERNGRLFLFYSANGCWQNHYCLGVMELIGDDPCDAACWKKDPKPFLVQGNGVYGPGHASFFRSPDGSEVWVCYHTLKEDNPSEEPMNRYANILKISFDESGYPVPTVTPAPDTLHEAPSGEIED